MDLQEKLEIYMPVIEASNLFYAIERSQIISLMDSSWRLCSGF